MNFDYVISNPPFNAGPTKGNLHLRIMERCAQMSGKCIVLAPIWWLGYTDEAKRNKERYMWSIGAATKRIEYLSPESSNRWFRGQCENTSLGIYELGETNVGFLGFLLLDKYKPEGTFCLPDNLGHGEFVESKLNDNINQNG